MKKLLLGIIAINLTFISANLALRSVEPVQAEDQRSLYELEDFIIDVIRATVEDPEDQRSDSTLKRFIEENCWVELAIKSNASGERWRDIACYKYDGWGN